MDPKLGIETNHCKCAVCGEYFTTEYNFEMHRRTERQNPYTRVCVNPESLLDKNGNARLVLNARGLWARPVKYKSVWSS